MCMRMISRTCCLVLAAFALSAGETAAEDNFIPWNADVKVGDELLPKTPSGPRRERAVCGAPQAAGHLLIRFFQVVISPQDGPNCRFHPTCSAYAAAAVERFGMFAGSLLAGDRVLRCNPYTPPGEDPLPMEIFGR